MNLLGQRSLLLTTLAVLLSLIIPVVVYRKAVYKPALNQVERTVLAFKPARFEINRKEWQPVQVRPLFTPGIPSTTQSGSTTQSHQAALPPPPPSPPPTLSFILQDGGKSMAIIGGTMVKTGDQVKGWQVERIERNRVLLRNRKGATWLTLD